uniref:Repressor protein n=1 Tax=Dulem virus 35 TaxID=3145753 RepID=A0AAU8B1A4_9CAUD
MFNGVEYVREMCKNKGVSISTLEKDCGFSNGYLNPKKLNKIPYDRAIKIAEYLDLDADYIATGKVKPKYYLNDETAAIAQEIFENKELRLLFDASRNADPEDIKAVHSMLLALKRKERGNID